MNPIQCVVICGTSVFAMGIEASLTERFDMAVVRLNPRLPGAAARITSLAPDAVIVERGQGDTELVLALLDREVPLVAVDAMQSVVTICTGRQIPASSVGDLVQVIEQVGRRGGYVAQPFRRAELISHPMARLRRADQRDEGQGKYLSPAPSIILDCERHELVIEGRNVYLNPNEFKVLELLMDHPGTTLSYDAILARVWGPERIGEPHTVRRHVYLLRKKIEPHPGSPRYILSDWGEGYYFQVPDENEDEDVE